MKTLPEPRTGTFKTWSAMNSRCHCRGDSGFRRYGQRGITVCQDWRRGGDGKGFERFFAYIGPRPSGHSIDRINNDRGYEPGNVRWATPKLQGLNRRLERRRFPLQQSLEAARGSIARTGRVFGIRATAALMGQIHDELVEKFGPIRLARLTDFSLNVEQAFWNRDYSSDSFHFAGLEAIANEVFPGRKKRKQVARRYRSRAPKRCSECGSVAHTKSRCPVRRTREREADAKLERELKRVERSRLAEQRRVEREQKRIQREFSRTRAA